MYSTWLTPSALNPFAGPALGLLFFAFFLYPLQQLRSGFVVGVLGDELTAEGLGKDGLGQFVDVGLGFFVALLDVVGDFEEGFDATDDFMLFFEMGGELKLKLSELAIQGFRCRNRSRLTWFISWRVHCRF